MTDVNKPHRTLPTYHPGSSKEAIENEPDWGEVPHHRIGFRDKNGRIAGISLPEGDSETDKQFLEHAKQLAEELRRKKERGDLLTVVDYMKNQEDYHLRWPSKHPAGWRYVLHTTENFLKFEQEWPINIKKREKEQQQKEEQERQKGEEKAKREHEWRRERGEITTHHDAYSIEHPPEQEEAKVKEGEAEKEQEQKKSKEKELQGKYSPQELAFLRTLKRESEYVSGLEIDSGNRVSPKANDPVMTTIDEADQYTPDNWIPRHPSLIRLTGKHPLNAEPQLSALFDAGLITPNDLHYVRNHAAVPHILWETHEININDGQKILTMDELVKFDAINIPIAMACDGTRRKELNMIRRSKGFDWGCGGVSCAFWKGALLRDVLISAGVNVKFSSHSQVRLWVHFEGADNPSEGKYTTCIPLEYVMDPTNDVILAYEMNNKPLPPDHGYPVRVMIPGYVGGRCVKWLQRIWITDKESTAYYHIYDNRVLPSFVIEKDSEFAETMFHHPSTACNEQNLNSLIVKPAQGEKIDLRSVKPGQTYRIQGLAYDGGGCEVQRVEVTLDGGETWLYCTRTCPVSLTGKQFPEAPVRHGKKFWTWLFWHVDVEVAHIVNAKSISVRCFNVFKNTQPQKPNWNLMGMMNNCWYTLKSKPVTDEETGALCLMFQHPVEPATGKGGWLQPSAEVQIETIKHEVPGPKREFTREEIEKHNSEDDCWIVINGKVYDATSVLSWHPGGKAPILGHAGKVHTETTEEFESIHDDYAEKKLSECVIGVVTDKAKAYMKKQKEKAAKDAAASSQKPGDTALIRKRWIQVKLIKTEHLSEDTQRYKFALPEGAKSLGLRTGEHIQLGFHFLDRMITRSYTPVRPILEDEKDGTFDLVVKSYFPTKDMPGGTISNILHELRPGEEVEIKGPMGELHYLGHGKFRVDSKELQFKNISLVLGGSAITPGWQLIKDILKSKDPHDPTKIALVDANKTEDDILLREEMQELMNEHPDQFKIDYILSEPGPDWKGEKGFVTEEHLKKYCYPPEKENVALICGPPTMIAKAVLPALKDWGYKEEVNLFGF
ncbi:nitrate reductase [Emydomyces testavorans]|uniref:Nitrate reductase [NADPH] n=1 Tax=Emydomyces testavorans TaxID=2070801 RepID=A0AAF0IJ91_9EURO|nr:nitrate reductase [Emydomyces testavorans]